MLVEKSKPLFGPIVGGNDYDLAQTQIIWRLLATDA